MTFQANPQEPLSGNKHLAYGTLLGVILAFPIPLYIFPVLLGTRFLSRFAPHVMWLVVWVHLSLPLWACVGLLAYFGFIFRSGLRIFHLCLLPLIFKMGGSGSEGMWVWLIALLPILTVSTVNHDRQTLVVGCLYLAIPFSLIFAWAHQDIDEIHRVGLLDMWSRRPSLSTDEVKQVISLKPFQHSWIEERNLSLEDKVKSGWMPESAQLEPNTRIQIARYLDEDSRRGEAYRLLWRARKQPQVAWEYVRFARLDGHEVNQELDTEPPEDVISDGEVILDEWWSTNQCRHWYIHTEEQDVNINLSFEVETDAHHAAMLTGQFDAESLEQEYVQGTHVLTWRGFDRGPHTVKLCFTNDFYSAEADINVHLLSIRVSDLVRIQE